MAYINHYGNVFCDCIAVSKPKYHEQFGVYEAEMTELSARCKENTPEGIQSVNLNLQFYGQFAIPAMKIPAGMCLVVFGREVTKQRLTGGRNILDRMLVVDWWTAREKDPLGMLAELSERRTIATREKELKEIFASWLNDCMPVIVQTVIGKIKELSANGRKASAGEKKEREKP